MRNQGQGHIRQRGKQNWQLKFDLGRDPATDEDERCGISGALVERRY